MNAVAPPRRHLPQPSFERNAARQASPPKRDGEPLHSAGDDGRVFAILLTLYWVAIYPIIRADRYYDDDLKRSMLGRTGWDSNGRPLTTFLMKVLQSYDHALVDISPFTQIAAIGVLAFCGVLIRRRYQIRSPLAAALIAFPLGAQPFFLENLSYKFDSLSMATGLLLALLPFIGIGRTRRGWWLGVLSLFGGLALYQPAGNAFMAFALLDLVNAQIRFEAPKTVAEKFGLRAIQLATAAVAYQLLIGSHIHGWVAEHARLVGGAELAGVVSHNAVLFLRYIIGSLNIHWWLYCLPLLATLLLVVVFAGFRYAIWQWRGQGACHGVACFALVPMVVALAVGSIAGPMLLMANPLFAARVLVAVGALLVAGLIALHETLVARGWSERWTFAVSVPFAIGMCVIASAYGNASAAQKEYEARMAAQFAEKVQEIEVSHPVESFLVDGTAGLSPAAAHVAHQVPLVGKLVLPYIDGRDNFLTRNFLRFYLPDLVRSNTLYPDSMVGAAVLDQTCWNEPTYASRTFDIFVIGTTAVFSFTDARARRCARLGFGPLPS